MSDARLFLRALLAAAKARNAGGRDPAAWASRLASQATLGRREDFDSVPIKAPRVYKEINEIFDPSTWRRTRSRSRPRRPHRCRRRLPRRLHSARRSRPRRHRAAARAGRHARARQRARPHPLGGLRLGNPGVRGRRRHHARRHAAQLDPADRRRARARRQAQGGRGQMPHRRRILGGAIPGNTTESRPLHGKGVFGFKCFLADSGVEESRRKHRSPRRRAFQHALSRFPRLAAIRGRRQCADDSSPTP